MATKNDKQWQVVCNELSGVLSRSNFVSLTRGECISLENSEGGCQRMVTPESFLNEAGAVWDRGNWKMNIHIIDVCSSNKWKTLQDVSDSGMLFSGHLWAETYGRKPSRYPRRTPSAGVRKSGKGRPSKFSAAPLGGLFCDEFKCLQTLLNDFSRALQSCATTQQRTTIDQWQSDIHDLLEQLSDGTAGEELTIGVVGCTGVGKSSLLNAIIDEPLLLPVDCSDACTSVAIKIQSHSEEETKYHARIDFLTKEEWLHELKSLCADLELSSSRLRDDHGGDHGSNQIYEIAVDKLKAVYGTEPKDKTFKDLKCKETGTMKDIFRNKSFRCIEADTSEELGHQLSTFTASSQSGGDGEWWPFVSSVSISIPNCKALPKGVVLVDLPGIRDANAARVAVTDEILKECDRVWIVCNMTRTIDDKSFMDQIDDELRRQLNLDGQTSTLVVICTKTDDFSRFDVQREFSKRRRRSNLSGQAEGLSTSKRNILFAKERNEKVKNKIKIECQKHAREAAAGMDGETSDFVTEVFTVSAIDYHELSTAGESTLSEEQGKPRVYDDVIDTEIPAVQSYLQRAGFESQKNKLQRVVRASQLLAEEACCLLADPGTQDSDKRSVAKKNFETCFGVETDSEKVISEFYNSIKGSNCLGKLKILLSKGVKQAVENAKNEVKEWGKLRAHTYRAVCHHKGEFYSAKTGSISFNSGLARPIIDALATVWEDVYGFKEGGLHQLAQEALLELKTGFTERMDRFRHILPTGIDDDRLKPAQLRVDRLIKNTCRNLSKFVSEERKLAHRTVKDTIEKELKSTYKDCAKKRGPGTFAIMKEIMNKSVTEGMPIPRVFETVEKRLTSQCDITTNRLVSQLSIVKETINFRLLQHLWRSESESLDTAEIQKVFSDLLKMPEQLEQSAHTEM